MYSEFKPNVLKYCLMRSNSEVKHFPTNNSGITWSVQITRHLFTLTCIRNEKPKIFDAFSVGFEMPAGTQLNRISKKLDRWSHM